MQSSRISIALTTFNGERYLPVLLNNIAGQSVLPCELVFCDDASTDSTVSLLESFAGGSSFPVKININVERLGVVNNFSRTFSLFVVR